MRKVICRITIIGIVFMAALTGAHSAGIPAPYAYGLDQFHFSGNGLGDYTDDFNDAALNTGWWDILDPTIVESGTSATFMNPGTLNRIDFSTPPYVSSMSYMQFDLNNQAPYMPDTSFKNGSGDYTITTVWDPAALLTNQFFIMNLSSIDVEPNENVNIGVANFDENVAAFFGIDAGPAVFFGWDYDITQGQILYQSAPISQSDLDGKIMLRLFFNDAADSFYGSFSLDGTEAGLSTFTNPVTHTTVLLDDAELSIGGESWAAVPIPSSAVLFILGVALLGGMGMARKS